MQLRPPLTSTLAPSRRSALAAPQDPCFPAASTAKVSRKQGIVYIIPAFHPHPDRHGFSQRRQYAKPKVCVMPPRAAERSRRAKPKVCVILSVKRSGAVELCALCASERFAACGETGSCRSTVKATASPKSRGYRSPPLLSHSRGVSPLGFGGAPTRSRDGNRCRHASSVHALEVRLRA